MSLLKLPSAIATIKLIKTIPARVNRSGSGTGLPFISMMELNVPTVKNTMKCIIKYIFRALELCLLKRVKNSEKQRGSASYIILLLTQAYDRLVNSEGKYIWNSGESFV